MCQKNLTKRMSPPLGGRSFCFALFGATILATSAYGQAGNEAASADLREEIKGLQAQQKALADRINELERRLDAPPASTVVSTSGPAMAVPAPVTSRPDPSTPEPTEATTQSSWMGTRFQNGFVLVETPDSSRVPFRLVLSDTSQFRYTATLPKSDTFTDHLGTVRPIGSRNDFSLNRNLLMFNGYAFDKRLKFSLITWASNSLATVVWGGSIGFEFNKAASLYAGYWSVPGSRSLTGTFPYFTHVERSMADNFFRPGFTQGIWSIGEITKGLHYHAFLGNGLNTLTIPTGKIDANLVYSGSSWWEPFGAYGMYDDYQGVTRPLVRVGTSYTRSREDRFSNLDQSNPENTSMFNSDGVLTFSTGAFAPGVTLEKATYRMSAIDGGLKWRGLAVNGQYYFRWLNDFLADGPLPLSSTFDHGFELSLAQFVVPKKLELYARTSYVYGNFNNAYEYAAGFKWFPLSTYHLWFLGEGIWINRSPVGSVITPYTGGLTGWAPAAQMMFTF